MYTKRQFQNPTRPIAVQDEITQVLTVIQPSLTLPMRRTFFLPATPIPDSIEHGASSTTTRPANETALLPTPVPISRKKKLLRTIALLLTAFLGLMIYLTWRSMNAVAASPTVSQQNYSNTAIITSTSNTSNITDTSTGQIAVYILGSIAHPGVYNLPADARVYQLVQAAGGLLPNANAVALNMAAKLTDGEEIYVLAIGEVAPTGINTPGVSDNGTPSTLAPGQLVNINTASETELRQALHISAATAQKIILYRTQHGPYTSVEQLLQVVSQSIYKKIKDLVTV